MKIYCNIEYIHVLGCTASEGSTLSKTFANRLAYKIVYVLANKN